MLTTFGLFVIKLLTFLCTIRVIPGYRPIVKFFSRLFLAAVLNQGSGFIKRSFGNSFNNTFVYLE